MDLRKIDPEDTGKFTDKEEIEEKTLSHLKELYDLLFLLYAENCHSLLIILQGIDASGKDGIIRHIFTGANPQGIRVHSFKRPTPEELRHDFLWRCHKLGPERGMATIFNRSYYEDVTTVRVHPEYLQARHLPGNPSPEKVFQQRYRQINEFERMLVENGTVILKFFLHISKEEQKERLEERLRDPTKKWKFSPEDVEERKFWPKYMDSFGQMLEETDTRHAPWVLVPANKKWYRNFVVSREIVHALRGLKMSFPKTDFRGVKIP
jgi:PPK2 family polyphosphate:nucleotide phosphotransferase